MDSFKELTQHAVSILPDSVIPAEIRAKAVLLETREVKVILPAYCWEFFDILKKRGDDTEGILTEIVLAGILAENGELHEIAVRLSCLAMSYKQKHSV